MHDEPRFLYHYTTQKGLLGIMKEKQMRASNIFYLNDSSEYTFALELLEKRLIACIRKLTGTTNPYRMNPKVREAALNLAHGVPDFLNSNVSFDDAKSIFIVTLKNALQSIKQNNHYKDKDIYVLSFSARDDDLSQWRGYCPDGMGFCLEFETQALKEHMKKEGLAIEECVYEKKEQKKKMDKLIEHSLADFRTAFNKRNKADEETTGERISWFKAFRKFKGLLPILKHEAFKDEKEWRFVKELSEKDLFSGKSSLEFREGRYMIIPFLNIPLAKKSEPIIMLKSIIVGPTSHKNLSEDSVRTVNALLRKHKIKGCEVRVSTIPYRIW